jgi:hypothetical protein
MTAAGSTDGFFVRSCFDEKLSVTIPTIRFTYGTRRMVDDMEWCKDDE